MLVALAVALDGPREPFPGRVRIAAHELRDSGARGGVAHPGQLALAGIVIVSSRQSALAFSVPFLFAPCVCGPVGHGRSL